MTHDNRGRLTVNTDGNWRLYTNTLPNGKTQKFEECKNGHVCYAGTCKVADKFFAGLEQVKAMGGKVEVETI